MNKKYKPKKKQNIESDLVKDNDSDDIHWFPGHINRAIKEIKERLKAVNIVLEVRDARSPLITSSMSVNLNMRGKSCLIILNKTDLADPEVVKLWKVWFSKQDVPFLFINCIDKSSLQNIVKLAKEIVHKKQLESNPGYIQKKKFRMMVIGLPNTGKSTIINKLAKRNATKAANKPGQTQHQLWVNVDEYLEILDTPGVISPVIGKKEHGIWLSALHAIPEKIVGAEDTACYIVNHLLKTDSKAFKELYKIENEEIDLLKALDQIAKLRGCIFKKNQYDYDRVYRIILNDFRSGKLGRISFGLPY